MNIKKLFKVSLVLLIFDLFIIIYIYDVLYMGVCKESFYTNGFRYYLFLLLIIFGFGINKKNLNYKVIKGFLLVVYVFILLDAYYIYTQLPEYTYNTAIEKVRTENTYMVEEYKHKTTITRYEGEKVYSILIKDKGLTYICEFNPYTGKYKLTLYEDYYLK